MLTPLAPAIDRDMGSNSFAGYLLRFINLSFFSPRQKAFQSAYSAYIWETGMFGKIFSRKNNPTDSKKSHSDTTVKQAAGHYPVAHLKIGANEVVQRLIAGLKNERGVHVESILGILGSLAGFCVIDSTFKEIAAAGHNPREGGLMRIETADGSHYYFGEPLNKKLAGTDLSLWALVAGIINHLGSNDYPDFAEISEYVASTLGGPNFGRPRIAKQHQPADLPINYVRQIWPFILPIIERHAPSLQERVPLFGFAVQNIIEMGRDVIPPAIAGKLVMECAVPMAKIDPSKITSKIPASPTAP